MDKQKYTVRLRRGYIQCYGCKRKLISSNHECRIKAGGQWVDNSEGVREERREKYHDVKYANVQDLLAHPFAQVTKVVDDFEEFMENKDNPQCSIDGNGVMTRKIEKESVTIEGVINETVSVPSSTPPKFWRLDF